MAKKEFKFSVTTLAGCKYSILKDLEANYQVEKAYRTKFYLSKLASLVKPSNVVWALRLPARKKIPGTVDGLTKSRCYVRPRQ